MHEYGDTFYRSSATFVGAGKTGFTVSGANAGRDFAVCGAGLQWQIGPQLSLFGGYDLQANDRQDYHTGSGGLQFVW